MYVTKKSMANAVENLTKHLEHVSDALAVSFIPPYSLFYSQLLGLIFHAIHLLTSMLGWL